MPQRVQRRRAPGWRSPAGAVYVGRPTKWGNPFRPKKRTERALALCVTTFEEMLHKGLLKISVDDVRQELRGKDLLCWCSAAQTCHADVLLKVANQ
jgi:hypothetical protein